MEEACQVEVQVRLSDGCQNLGSVERSGEDGKEKNPGDGENIYRHS